MKERNKERKKERKRMCQRDLFWIINPLLFKLVTLIKMFRNIRNFKALAIFCGCTARFVSDLVGNPEDSFSQLIYYKSFCCDPLRCLLSMSESVLSSGFYVMRYTRGGQVIFEQNSK